VVLSLERDHLLKQVAAAVPDPALRSVPVRVAVDGIDGAGKTVFADDLAEALKQLGREVVRVSVDGFRAARDRRYARGVLSAEGFWLDSYDYEAFEQQVLAPFAPDGSRRFRRTAHEGAADASPDEPWEQAGDECVLVVDGNFLHRDELAKAWDFSLFLAIKLKTAVSRLASRDGTSPDPDDARTRRHIGGQRLYLRSCRPASRATMVIDNDDFDKPVIRRR
jgi:uridine kinase